MFESDETDEWLAPMFAAMTKRNTAGGRTLGTLIQFVAIDGHVDWVALGQLMRNELGWHDYPAYSLAQSRAR